MRFCEVTLGVREPDACARFYVDVLGLPADGPRAVRVGATRLAFEPADTPNVHHLAFNVPEDRLQDVMNWLRGRGVALLESDGGPTYDYAHWNAHAAYFLDASGNILEVIARHELDNGAAGPVGPHSLLDVSEVGLVVADVAAAVDALERALPAARRYRPPGPRFAPLGDAHGLLILVAEGRPWFPTMGAVAAPAPLRVRVEGLAAEVAPIAGRPYAFLPA